MVHYCSLFPDTRSCYTKTGPGDFPACNRHSVGKQPGHRPFYNTTKKVGAQIQTDIQKTLTSWVKKHLSWSRRQVKKSSSAHQLGVNRVWACPDVLYTCTGMLLRSLTCHSRCGVCYTASPLSNNTEDPFKTEKYLMLPNYVDTVIQHIWHHGWDDI